MVTNTTRRSYGLAYYENSAIAAKQNRKKQSYWLMTLKLHRNIMGLLKCRLLWLGIELWSPYPGSDARKVKGLINLAWKSVRNKIADKFDLYNQPFTKTQTICYAPFRQPGALPERAPPSINGAKQRARGRQRLSLFKSKNIFFHTKHL